MIWIPTIIAAFAAAAAIFSAINSHLSAKHNQASVTLAEKIAKSNLFVQCLNVYLSIMKKEAEAISEQDCLAAIDSQRSLVDLLWFEFRMWRRGLIDDDDFGAWIDARRRRYDTDPSKDQRFPVANLPTKGAERVEYIQHNVVNGDVLVSFKRVWDHLIRIKYYPEGDEFMGLISQVHGTERTIRQLLDTFKSTPTRK